MTSSSSIAAEVLLNKSLNSFLLTNPDLPAEINNNKKERRFIKEKKDYVGHYHDDLISSFRVVFLTSFLCELAGV